jgi:hypothetical protein
VDTWLPDSLGGKREGWQHTNEKKKTGFFQGTIRASEAYDQASTDLIINEYAKRFQWFHRCHPDAIRITLKSCVESMMGM